MTDIVLLTTFVVGWISMCYFITEKIARNGG